MSSASKEWVRECPNADYTVLLQCARAIPAEVHAPSISSAIVTGQPGPITVELLDDSHEPEGPAVLEWNPVAGA